MVGLQTAWSFIMQGLDWTGLDGDGLLHLPQRTATHEAEPKCGVPMTKPLCPPAPLVQGCPPPLAYADGCSRLETHVHVVVSSRSTAPITSAPCMDRAVELSRINCYLSISAGICFSPSRPGKAVYTSASTLIHKPCQLRIGRLRARVGAVNSQIRTLSH